MKQTLFFLFAFLPAFITANAQPAITNTDMPAPNDTVKRTVVASLSAINYTTADSNFTWDFSMVTGTNKTIDTFLSVFSTPIAYIATYSDPFDQAHMATVASKQPTAFSPPGITIKDIYAFYKATTSYYGQVGIGASINGLTVPVKFDNADMIYRFPLLFGNVDSSVSKYSLNVPGFGYYGETKHRTNYVDGWGTLYLPADTFYVVRVRSVIRTFDSIYADTLHLGFGFNRTETDYDWLAKNYQIPVFHVTKGQGMGGTTNGYFYDNRPADYGIKQNDKLKDFSLWPNPAADHIMIDYPNATANLQWMIIDINGRTILQGSLSCATSDISIDKLKPGTYLFRINRGGNILSKVFIKE